MTAWTRTLATTAWLALAATATPAAAAPSAAMALPELLAHLARTSPEVQAAAAQVQAVAAMRDVAGKWPEPTATVAVQPLPVETRVGPQRLRVAVAQPIPWISRLNRQAEAVDAGANAARRTRDAVLARVRRDVRVPWARLAWLSRVAGIVKQQRDLLLEFEPSVLTRLRTGKASFEDAQRLRLMIGELDERYQSLLDQQSAVAAQVRAAAGVASTQPLAPASFEADPLDQRAIPALEQLHKALADNPELVAAQSRVGAAEASVVAADLRRMPDFTVGLDWIMVGQARMAGVADSGTDALMVMATVKLPTSLSAYDGEVAASRARVAQARAGHEAVQRKSEARLAQLLFELRDARRKRTLYAGDLVPRAESALRAALTAYSADRTGFNELIDLEDKLLRFQIRLASAEAARVSAQANLELLLGRPLTDLLAAPKEGPR